MADQMDRLEIAIEAQAKKAAQEIDILYNQLVKVDTVLKSSARGYTSMAKGINKISTSIGKLSSASGNINSMLGSIQALGNTLSSAFGNGASIDKSVTSLVNAIAKLGKESGGILDAANNMPALTASLEQFFDAMAQVPEIDNRTVRMTQAIARMAAAGDKAGTVSVNMSHSFSTTAKSTINLGNAFKTCAKVITSFISLGVKAQVGIVKLGASAVKAFMNIGNGAKHVQRATISLKNLLSVALGFYGIRSLFNWGKDAIELSSDLTEVQNVVENAFGEKGTAAVEKFVETSRTEFGMAELLAKQVSSRFQAMGVSMGITGQQVAKANANISGSMVDAYDKTTASMSAMSLNLTRLAADMASFYNVDQAESAEALNAVFTGMTRPLRRFGLDLTQATLQEWALKQGMDVDVQSMTQAEKTLLRYQYVMANTTMVQGDFARTSMTWANQIRILRQNFEVLGSTIGNILINTFRPLVIWLNNAMGAVISFAETIGNALGTIFGWQILHTPSGSVADYYEDMADATDSIGTAGDNAADGLDNATKSAKEFQETVLGFDKLNKLSAVPIATTPKSSGSGGGTPAGSGGVAPASGAGTQFSVVKKDSWLEDYKSEIDSLYKLGDYISQKLTEAMERINWDAAYEKARGFGTGLADFLNGLISPELFKAVGETVASSLNTALQLLNGFGTKFEWGEFGTSLSSGLVSYLTTFDWKLAAEDFNTLVNGIQTTIGAALDDFNSKDGFALVGNKVGTYVRDILTNHNWDLMADNFVSLANGIVKAASSAVTALGNEDGFAVIGKKAGHFVRKVLMNYDWRITAKLFTDLANGIVRGARNAIEEVGRNNGFYVIGSKVSSFIKTTLGGIKWDTEVYPAANEFASGLASFLNGLFNEETFSSVGSTVASFLNTALHGLDTFGATFEWDKFGISLAAGINSFFNTFEFSTLASSLNNWANGLLTTAKDLLVNVRWFEIGQKIGEFIKAINFKGWLKGAEDLLAEAVQDVIDLAKGIIDPSGLGTPITDALDKLGESFNTLKNAVDWEALGTAVGNVVKALEPAVAGFANGFISVFETLARIGGEALNKIGEGLQKIADALNTVPPEILKNIGTGLGTIAGVLVTINGLDKVVGIVTGVIGKITGTSTAVGKVATAVGKVGTNSKDAFNPVANLFREIVKSKGGIEGIAIALSVQLGEALQIFDEKARGENGILSEMGGLMDSIATQFAPDMETEIRNLKDELENSGASAEESKDAFVEFFQGKHVTAEKFQTAAGLVRTEMSLTEDQTTILDGIIEGLGDTVDETGQQMTLSKEDYNGLKDILWDISNEAGLGTEAMEVFDTTLKQDVGATTAKDAIDKVKQSMSDMGLETSTLDTKIKDTMPGLYNEITNGAEPAKMSIGDLRKEFYDLADNAQAKSETIKSNTTNAFDEIGKKSDDANTKTGKFKTDLWAFAGGIFSQTLLMLAMGTTFSTLGDKSDTAKGQVDNLKTKVGEFVDDIKAKKTTAQTNAGELGSIVPEEMAAKIEANKEKVYDASETLALRSIEGIKDEFGYDGTDMTALVDLSKSADDGLAKGMNDNAEVVKKAAENLAAVSTIQTIRDELDSNSPSKVMEDIGKDIIDGLVDGLDNNASDATDAIGNLVDDMLDEITGQDALDSFRTAGESLADEVSSGMTVTDFSGVPDAWYTAMNFTDLNSNLYSAGQSAAKNFADGMKTLDMPTISYYRASWDYHDDDSDGSWDTATPVYKSYWHYAKGGFPNRGEMFIANEAGPEMIGRMGHKNVVANNMQITEGIKAAVVDGMMEVAMATSNRDDSVPYVINMRVVTDDDETLARRVEKGRMKRDSRYSPTPSYA